ncbi:hypothetical protein GQ457_10G010520 [Hibiscus cannabinus]
MVFDANFVQRLDLIYVSQQLSTDYVATFSICPPEGWIKANSDGAMDPSSGKTVASEVLRDEHGVWIFDFSCSLGCCSILMVELWAAHDALLHAWRLGFRQVELETNNREVVHILCRDYDVLIGSAIVDALHGLLSR